MAKVVWNKQDFEACDCFGKPLEEGKDILYARTLYGRKPIIVSGIIHNIDPVKGVQISYNEWNVRPDPNKPGSVINVENVVTVRVKTFDVSPFNPGKGIFPHIYQF